MSQFWLRASTGAAVVLSSIVSAAAQESVKSTPKDTNIYTRAAVAGDTRATAPAAPNPAAALGAPVAPPPTTTKVMRVFDVIVNNTNTNLKNTDTIGGTEASLAINPNNRNEIDVTGFSSAWGSGNAAIWHSTDGGQTWTKEFTIPVPPGVSSAFTNNCPCDQTLDWGTTNVLFGTFLADNNVTGIVFSGSTTNPTLAGSWAWWTSGGVAQQTDLNSTNADQPWLLYNRGTGNAAFQNVYVAYDDFSVSPATMRVAASINQSPPVFTSDQATGSSGLGGINPGHRLAADPRNGWMYSLYQNCTANCGSDPKTISYMLNRSTDQGSTWSLNSSSTGISVASAQSHQPTPKFGTVNALLGGIDHAAVDPSTGDLYYVYGYLDAGNNNNLQIVRVFDNGMGGVTVGSPNNVTSGNTCAIPSVAVTSHSTVGVFFYCYNGIVSGFPQFTAWLGVSTNQGQSFAYQDLVTFLSPATDNGNARQRVLGDYEQMKAIDNCFYGGIVANRAAFFGTTAIDDPVFFKACFGQSASSHDMSGDGFSDILWYNGSTGQVVTWLVNGTTVIGGGGLGSVGSPWAIVGQRDFNGDGFSDLLWRNDTSGQLVTWFTNGTSVTGGGSLGSAASPWSVAGTGDFNGDGFGDVLWYNSSTGQLVIWLTNGTSVIGGGSPGSAPLPWLPSQTGDFNSDGKSDILWYNSSTGQLVIWLVSGTSVIGGGSPGSAGSPWSLQVAGSD
jgi:hypothetical protein